MLPAHSDRTPSQKNLVAKFYAEYAALNCDVDELDTMQRAVYRDKNITDAEAEARLTALYALVAEAYEFYSA